MSACIEFQGAKTHGHGRVRYHGRLEYAHRVAWWQANRNIPEGYDLHHTCHNRACINVWHLTLVLHNQHATLDSSETCRVCGGTRWKIRKNGHRYCMDCDLDRHLG